MIALQLDECTAPIGSNNSPAELLTAIGIELAYDSTTTVLRLPFGPGLASCESGSGMIRVGLGLAFSFPKYLDTVEVEDDTGVRS
jgi:hypothetical protein